MKFLVIQTAFLGDAVLATPVLEKLHRFYPQAKIDFLLRKGNEQLFTGHPFLNECLVWDKGKNKYNNLFKLIGRNRKQHYDYIINLQRFAASGFITILSGGKKTIGFDKNPLSFFFSERYKHEISANGKQHEVDRNLKLIESFTDTSFQTPSLYPTQDDYRKTLPLKNAPYICIAPASVWFTKQLPAEKWVELIQLYSKNNTTIYLLGAPSDKLLCENILKASNGNVKSLAGELSLLQTAALMKDAVMNFVNDSAPMHIASAMDAPVTAFYCSTVPAFGFGPLSGTSRIVETKIELSCRPCGLHGYKECPLGHFHCAKTINIKEQIPVE